MTRAQRRREQRARVAELLTAGTYVPRKPRSHYQTADIRDAVQGDIAAMRVQLEHQRRARDPQWAFHSDSDVRHPVSLIEGANVSAE